MMAYLLLAIGIWHAIDVTRTITDRAAKGLAHAFAFLLVVQAGIGIMTLLLVVPLPLALLHQAVAIVLLTIATVHASRLLSKGAPRAVSTAAAQPA